MAMKEAVLTSVLSEKLKLTLTRVKQLRQSISRSNEAKITYVGLISMP